VNPLSEVVIQSTGPDSQAPQAGWAQVLTAGALTGSVILRETVGSGAIEAQAPIDFRSGNAYFLPFDNTVGAWRHSSAESKCVGQLRGPAANRLQDRRLTNLRRCTRQALERRY